MIVKNFEIDKIKNNKSKFFLFYGDNQGLKEEILEFIRKKNSSSRTTYYENEVIKDSENIISSITTKSFFDNEKFIVIKKVTDKIKNIIEHLIEKNPDETTIILDADILEKKSKLRNFFEKENNLLCIPFYPDNFQALNRLANKFFNEHNVSISNESINLLIQRANGQRHFLNNELNKIKSFLIDKKQINLNEIEKITNLSSNHEISELVDTCLSKNKNRLNNIINENNFSNDDAILIIRTFLRKAKRLLKITENTDQKEVDQVIASYKPPIFWKDKEIIKNQLNFWSNKEIRNLIKEINETELLIKKNLTLSITILINFIFNKANKASN